MLKGSILKRIVKEEEGQGIVVALVSLGVLLVFMGLALDVGTLFRARRNVQIAADAAATAAALDYHYNQSVTSAKAAGQTASTANGYTNNTSSCPSTAATCVKINMPPQSGPNTAYTSFAEAIVNAPSQTTFMGLMGLHSVNVAARAVAGNPAASKGCMYVLGQGSDTLHLQGAYSISGGTTCAAGQPQACGIVVDSTDSAAVKVTGGGGCVNASFFNVAGGYSGHNTGPTPVTTNVGNVGGDPFVNQVASIAQPTTSNPTNGCTQSSSLTAINATNYATVNALIPSNPSGVTTICFPNAVDISGTVPLNGSTPGVLYIFEKGLTIDVGANATFGSGTYTTSTNTFTNTSGATIELETGTLTQASNSNLNIFAPTTGLNGTTNAIAIWQPVSNTTALQVQFGSNNETLDGFIYAPGADVTMHDNGGGVSATGVVAYTMTIKSSSLILPNYNTANQATTPLTAINLVE
jgi:Putative Flp pilus-assembly TadE/G-like